MEKWRVLASKEIVANPWLRVREDRCLTERGTLVESFFVVEKTDFATIVAITVAKELLLVRQYKHPAANVVVECPAGYVNQGEAPIDAAVRELREETGYRPGNIRPLASWLVSPGMASTRGHLFLVTDAEPAGEQELDLTEDIELFTVDFSAAVRMVQRGGLISDMSSAAAIMLANQALAGGVSQ